jgi:type I restriction enzyme S subunit
MTDWPVKTLGDICRIEMGRTPSRGDSKGWDKALKTANHWASIADLTACNGRVLTSTKERISDFAAKTTKVVPAGTLMMSFKLSIGKLAFAGCDLYTNEAIAAFHLNEKSNVDSDFLYWALSVVDWSALTKGSEKVKGATMNKAKLNLLEIPVPPLAEQKRIVELLDAATACVTELAACYEQASTHADNLFTSALRAALEGNSDWPVKTLDDLCDIYQPQTIGMKDLIADGKYIVYGANGPIGRYDRFNHEKSEVTVTCRGATCGTVNVTPPEVWITGNAMVVRPNEMEMSKEMMRYVLEGLDYSRIITGAAQPQITRQTLAPSTIQVPPLEEQKKVVAHLDSMRAKMSEMVAAYHAKLTAAKNLRQSILEAAFEGDL